MKYLVKFTGLTTMKPYVVGGNKQRMRAERRSGETTARQQKKAAKAYRRELKALNAA